ncbi:hypothetical protein CKO28_14325 [Rhodovibrio sodomensis]|uniref:DNA 3'-5' helicase n=1 Tax=Rhodovibrio sodomensis TaxID=1088 RepID=A0ABS1DFH7_9PROT|nr:ATP-dependent helicase [Rhodovibrio sodomensis]MBK1669210.1 hypothetical protein [Rhodovibrio sodomensis]
MPKNDPAAELNEAQRAAAVAGGGPHLVLAGPGTGKTKTLVSRFAILIQRGVDPKRVLCVTFTKKAADEMVERLSPYLSGVGKRDLSVGTFHSLSGRLLREFASHAGLTRDFDIYADRDQARLLAEERIWWDADDGGEITEIISVAKDSLLTPDSFRKDAEKRLKDGKIGANDWRFRAAAAYRRYQKALQDRNAADFGDLLNHVVFTLRDNPEIAKEVSRRYDYLLVDEFQDVNPAQVAFLDLLMAANPNIWAVGDDDQTLYGFRASDVRFILNFPKRHPDTTVHKLVENYRSTPAILHPSLQLIGANRKRFSKPLRPNRSGGAKVVCAEFETAEAEARWIVECVEKLIERGDDPSSIGVLCRVGHVGSRLQMRFRDKKIPVDLRGIQDFWSTPEVRAFVGVLRVTADERHPDRTHAFGSAARQRKYGQLADELRQEKADFATQCQRAAKLVAAESLTNKDEGVRERWRRNTGIARGVAAELGSIEALEEEIERSTAAKRFGGNRSAVALSTAHSSKGLEWDTVFIAGFEQNLMPHKLAEDPEEERRIAYVAMTRARKVLCMSWSELRDETPGGPSPFLWEALSGSSDATIDWRGKPDGKPWETAPPEPPKNAKEVFNEKMERAFGPGESRKSKAEARRQPQPGSSTGSSRSGEKFSDREVDRLAGLYLKHGDVADLAKSVHRGAPEVAKAILGHWGVHLDDVDCPEGTLALVMTRLQGGPKSVKRRIEMLRQQAGKRGLTDADLRAPIRSGPLAGKSPAAWVATGKTPFEALKEIGSR